MSNKPRRKKPPSPGGRGGPATGAAPGGLDLNSMMAQVQEMQAQMAATQESLAEEEVEATAGGGMVKAVVSGTKELLSIEIDPEVVDPADVEMLQDLVVAAVNEALRQADELAGSKMGGTPGGLDLGGLDLSALGLGDIGGLLGGKS